ncbi:MAG: hypothetical protein ABI175_12260 [Polyangiales bacterium]
MRRPSPQQIERARRMLQHERGRGEARAGDDAAAAGRVLDTIHAQLDPLIGSTGVHALLVRSAQVANRAFSLAVEVGDSTSCRESLLRLEPAMAGDAAAHVFATFFALLTTLIGERLTTEVMRNWPVQEDPVQEDPKETTP